MARYYEESALIELIKNKQLIFEESTPVDEAIASQIDAVIEGIGELPAADVVPRVEVQMIFEELHKEARCRAQKKSDADDARVYDPRKDMSGLGVVSWAVVANNRLEELSRAVNAKMALVRESAMTDAERLKAFRQLAVWARELDLTVKLVLEMLKEGTKNENSQGY